MLYKWANGYSPKGVDANKAGEICEQLAERGDLSGKALVDISRPVDAPLHSCFEWDDGIAAEKYREQQGRVIIRHIVLVEEPIEESKETTEVKAFYHLESQEQDYTPIKVIAKSEALTNELLASALRELNWFKKKYNTLSELVPVMDAIDVVMANTGGETDEME